MPGGVRRAPVPDGPIRAFFDRLHRQHRLAGEPSTRALASKVAYSHTTIHQAMVGPGIPRWGLVELLVEALGGDIAEFRELWVKARDEEDRLGRGSSSNSHSDLTPDSGVSPAVSTWSTLARASDPDRSGNTGDAIPAAPLPHAALAPPEGTKETLEEVGRELGQRAWTEEREQGFRDALQFARELPWHALEGLAQAGFDIPKWIAGWRQGWQDIVLDRAPKRAVVASWQPAAARYLGSLADPIGYDESSSTPTRLYVTGFSDGLRAAWHQAGGNVATRLAGEESAPAEVSLPGRPVDPEASISPAAELAGRLTDLLRGHGGLPLGQVEDVGVRLLHALRDAFERHTSDIGLPENAQVTIDWMHAPSCTYGDRPYRPIHGRGPTALKVKATMTGVVEAHSEVTPFPGISRDRDADYGLIVIDANRSTVEPLWLHIKELHPTVTDSGLSRIDGWVLGRVRDLLGGLEVMVQ